MVRLVWSSSFVESVACCGCELRHHGCCQHHIRFSRNQGQWIEARDYLELALKLRPTYAIASANLGEVYVRLAAKAYENASQSRTNQRFYINRAKALNEMLKQKPDSALPQSNLQPTNPKESTPSNGESSSKNQ